MPIAADVVKNNVGSRKISAKPTDPSMKHKAPRRPSSKPVVIANTVTVTAITTKRKMGKPLMRICENRKAARYGLSFAKFVSVLFRSSLLPGGRTLSSILVPVLIAVAAPACNVPLRELRSASIELVSVETALFVDMLTSKELWKLSGKRLF